MNFTGKWVMNGDWRNFKIFMKYPIWIDSFKKDIDDIEWTHFQMILFFKDTGRNKKGRISESKPLFDAFRTLRKKWLQMLQQLGDMLKSGKQWDIATLLVSIFWLLAWWAWAARLGLNLWRKMVVSQARNGLSTVPKMMRNSMKAVSRSAWKVFILCEK